MDKLERLTKLWKEGALTDAEFQDQKTKLLGGISGTTKLIASGVSAVALFGAAFGATYVYNSHIKPAFNQPAITVPIANETVAATPVADQPAATAQAVGNAVQNSVGNAAIPDAPKRVDLSAPLPDKPLLLTSFDAVMSNCPSISTMSQSYSEVFAQNHHVAVSSVAVMPNSGWLLKDPNGVDKSCVIKIDSPVGPVRCQTNAVVKYPDGTVGAHMRPGDMNIICEDTDKQVFYLASSPDSYK